MNRSHSRFPAGSVGLAMLLLRLADGFGLLSEAVHLFTPAGATPETTSGALLGVVLMGSAIMLLLGFRTTLAGTAAAVCTAGWVALSVDRVEASTREMYPWLFLFALVFVLSGAIALAGPGGYSLDARLSGWRRLDLASGHPHDSHEWDSWS